MKSQVEILKDEKNQSYISKMCAPLIKQLFSNEKIDAMVFGQTKTSGCAQAAIGVLSMLSIKQYFIGIANNNLLLLQKDFWGRIGEIRRIPILSVNSAKFMKGVLNDSLKIEMNEEPKVLDLQVIYRYRIQSMNIETIINNK